MYDSFTPLYEHFKLLGLPNAIINSKPVQIENLSINGNKLKTKGRNLSKLPDTVPEFDDETMQEDKKKKFKILKIKPRRLILNVSMTRYPILRKIAKYEFNFFISNRDMFLPIPSTFENIEVKGVGQAMEAAALQKRDPDDDYFDIFWMDGAGQRNLDRFAQLKTYQRINHFPGMNIICRKNELGKLLNFMHRRFPKDFDFYPKTWMMPQDTRDFEIHVKEKREQLQNIAHMTGCQYDDPVFIVKPEGGC